MDRKTVGEAMVIVGAVLKVLFLVAIIPLAVVGILAAGLGRGSSPQPTWTSGLRFDA